MRFAHVMEYVLEKKQVKELVQKDVKPVLVEMVDVKKEAGIPEQIDFNEEVIRVDVTESVTLSSSVWSWKTESRENGLLVGFENLQVCLFEF